MIITSETGLHIASTLNGVVATQKSGDRNVSISKSKPKPQKIVQRVVLAKDSGDTDDEPVIGGLQDEDDSLECAAALASPLKGSESRALTKVNSIHISLNLSLTQILLT